jgi:hypothetical protein
LSTNIRYEYASTEDREILNEMLQTEDYQNLNGYNIRFALIYVTTEDDKSGVVLPTFKNLPYKVKYNNAKDRLLKKIDIEIQLDTEYWEDITDIEKQAVIDGALNQIEIVEKKNLPAYNDDGTVKIKLRKPDMVYEGFSRIAEKYGSDSPEIKKYRHLNSEFEDILV